MFGKNVPVPFCSSFVPASFQCALSVLKISKRKKTSRHKTESYVQWWSFFLFHTFLLTPTFISLIWGFLLYHCLLPLLVAFWDSEAVQRVRGKESQCNSHNCSAPRSRMPRIVQPPQHKGTGSWLQWGEHPLLQTPQPSSSGSSGCFPMYESKKSC